MSDYTRREAAYDALMLFRSAKINQGDTEDDDLAQAFHSLKRYITRIEQAEREAEDALVTKETGKGGAIVRAVDPMPDPEKVWRTAQGAYVTGNPHNGEGWWISFSGLTALEDAWGTRWEWGRTGPWVEVTNPRTHHLVKAACYLPDEDYAGDES